MIYIPTQVIDVISNYVKIESDFFGSTTKQLQSINVKLINLWYFIYTKQSQDDTESLSLYTNLSKKQLQKFNAKINGKQFGYAKLVSYLKNCNLIDVNDKYSVGNFTKGYRVITSFLKNTKFTELNIDLDIITSNTKEKNYWKQLYTEQSNLIEDCYNTKINIDNYIYWMQNNIGMELKPIIQNGIVRKRFLTEERIYNYINRCLKVNFNNLWFKISDEGRFYSSISNLPYTSLPFILFYKRPVKEIDIKNSQPLLLSTLINDTKYKKDVENGEFYDKVAEELNITRNDFKILSYKYIFFSPKKLSSGKILDAMNNIYPGLIDKINSIKENTELAKKLQKLESDIFVNGLGKTNTRKLLRHDSVLVHEEELQDVKSFLVNEYRKLNIKIKL